jgi:hypothetical protein
MIFFSCPSLIFFNSQPFKIFIADQVNKNRLTELEAY